MGSSQRSGATLERVTAEAYSGDATLIDQLATDWRALCDEAPDSQPSYRPEWVASFARAFAPSDQLVVVAARSEGRLVAVLPLVTRRGLDGLPARKLTSAANEHTSPLDLVRAAGDRGEAGLEAVWRQLRTMADWDLLEFPDMPSGGSLSRLLRLARRDGYPVAVRESMRSPYIPLPERGGTVDVVLSEVDTKFRSNLRRRMRRLQASGPVRLRRHDRADRDVLNQFYELEASGWKGSQGTAIACDPAARRFYDDAAREAERNDSLALYTLACGDRPVAMHFGLVHRGRYYLVKTAYDPAVKECSPGQLIVLEVLRDLLSRGVCEFDFMGMSMAWKRDWTNHERVYLRGLLFRTSPRGRILHAARTVVGPRVKRAVRRLRPRRCTDDSTT